MTAPTKRLGYRPWMEPAPMPDGVTMTVSTVKTFDDASAGGRAIVCWLRQRFPQA